MFYIGDVISPLLQNWFFLEMDYDCNYLEMDYDCTDGYTTRGEKILKTNDFGKRSYKVNYIIARL